MLLLDAIVAAALPLLAAQGVSTSAFRTGGAPSPPSLVATRAERRPDIDGRLDEDFWASAPVADGFTQVSPRDGAPPTERTEVRVAYDADALYVGVRLHDSKPSDIIARLARHDAETNGDAFTISIDSYHDRRTAFRFSVNAAGVRSDELVSNDALNGDASWDPVWNAATRIDGEGWYAEFRIPLSQLRFSDADEQTWGINFTRYVARTAELLRWSWAPSSEAGSVSRYGTLTGIRGISSSRARRIEVTPYVVTQADFATGLDPRDPYHGPSASSLSAGGDLKVGISSGLTLNATVNPDFGQVEADPAEVNLTVYESYFQERRPFFVEGANLFDFGAGGGGTTFGAPTLFYSRRIGKAPPGGSPADAEFVDVPEVTRIAAAGKISGRALGWSVGGLYALTPTETAPYRTGSGDEGDVVVDPRTHYAVASLRRDFGEGRTTLGVMGTLVKRDIASPELAWLRTSATSGGADFFHRFGGGAYSVGGVVSGSMLRGDPASISAVQRASAHYFQRPDQGYVTFDPAARSLSGWAAALSGGKVAGSWLVGADFFAYSPGYDVGEMGFQSSSDRIFQGVNVRHRWLQPTRYFLSAQAYLNASRQTNFGGTTVSRGLYFGGSAQLRNQWSASVGGVLNPATLNDRVTRGGPLIEIPRQWNVAASLQTDLRRSVAGSLFGGLTRNRSGGYVNQLSLSVAMRPSAATTLTLSPGYSEVHSAAGYITVADDPFATTMYGRRYVVADQTQRTLDLSARGDLALSPRLSLQLYVQPFVSAVENRGFKAFDRAGGFAFLVYGRDGASTIAYDDHGRVYAVDADGAGSAPSIAFRNPDFRLRSLRTNAVLRWEFGAGSTAYLAWAHGRQVFLDDATFDVRRDLGDLLGDDQRNRLLLKVNYWLNPWS